MEGCARCCAGQRKELETGEERVWAEAPRRHGMLGTGKPFSVAGTQDAQ